MSTVSRISTGFSKVQSWLNVSDKTVDQHYTDGIKMDGYRNIAIQLTGSSATSGVTFKIYGTLNTDAATPADGDASPSVDWVDLSTSILGATSVTLDSGNSGIYFVDTYKMLYKYIIQYVPDDSTNTAKVFIRRY